jgi:lantibiotic leader peptide-processing serine protease
MGSIMGRARQNLTSSLPPPNFALMAIHRIPTLALVGSLAVALAACSDSSTLAPKKETAVAVALPQAARYIVLLANPGPVPSALSSAITAEGGKVLHAHAGTGLVLVAGLSAQQAGALRSRGDVQSVAPDIRRQFIREPVALRRVTAAERMAVPSARSGAHVRGDPLTAGFYASGQQWNLSQIHADSGWVEAPTQGSGQTVYILDTGVDTAHIELKGHVNTSLSTTFAFAATDTLEQNPLPFWHDVVGHGTFVSSIVTSNADTLSAVAPQATIVMVRVLDDEGSGSDFSIIEGMLYAADQGATIINMSLGGYLDRTSGSYLSLADYYQRVTDYAVARGALIVVAAGNEAVNTNTGSTTGGGSYVDSLNVPAGLHHLVSVGATGPDHFTNFDDLAVYSNFGKADVAVFAPGGNTASGSDSDLVVGAGSSFNPICSSGGEGCYLIGAGTSFASPHVAGEAAVVLSHATSTRSPAALETCLLNSATELNGDRPDITFDFGRIDVLNAIKASACQ